MKFKNDKSYDGARSLQITDKEGDTLNVVSFGKKEKGSYDVILAIDFEVVGLSRSKALKLAWAIIDELNPSMLA